MSDERLTDEQVREVERGLIKAFEAILKIAVPSRKTKRDIETYTRAVHAICDELIESREKVAELLHHDSITGGLYSAALKRVAELEAELEGERARVESWKVMEQELSADVEKWYTRVAELEATLQEIAKVTRPTNTHALRLQDIRVEGGAIVGLGELLGGEG